MDPDPRNDARMLSIKESVGQTLSTRSPALETSDIQATVLRPRPSPYRGRHANAPNPASPRHPSATIAMSSFLNTTTS
jgi:hypothetical protein